MKKLLPKFAYLARIIPKNRIFQQKEVKRNYLFKPPIRGRAFGYEGNYGVKKKTEMSNSKVSLCLTKLDEKQIFCSYFKKLSDIPVFLDFNALENISLVINYFAKMVTKCLFFYPILTNDGLIFLYEHLVEEIITKFCISGHNHPQK